MTCDKKKCFSSFFFFIIEKSFSVLDFVCKLNCKLSFVIND